MYFIPNQRINDIIAINESLMQVKAEVTTVFYVFEDLKLMHLVIVFIMNVNST